MSGDLLREAAALLRQQAKDATPGSWRTEPPSAEYMEAIGFRDLLAVVGEGGAGDITDYVESGDAKYIATMHPRVGLTLANWLDKTADDHRRFRLRRGSDWFPLAVARAILGRQS